MNLIGASILAVLLALVLAAPRRGAALALAAGVLFLTQAQAVNVLGLNVFAVRFLELAGFLRVMTRREFSSANLNRIDKTLLTLYLYTAIVYCLRSSEGLAYAIGRTVDACLCYFCWRGLIAGLDDWESFLKSFVFLLAPYTSLVLLEGLTHHNSFSWIGGGMFDWVRGGRFRCVGTFRNPDLLGTLGATFLPLYLGWAWGRAERWRAGLGVGLCLAIVWASNSGGPLGVTAVGLAGWGLWRVRTRMRKLRWAMALGLAALAVVMNAPIWYLLAKVSAITGGDGWHRSYLMEVTFRHLKQWWLAGMPMRETGDWFPYQVNSGADITNQFIAFGLDAGLGALVLFIFLFQRAFSRLGAALAAVRAAGPPMSDHEPLLWGLGVMLAAHVANGFGITYFDQSYVLWFLQLAALSGVTAQILESPASLPEASEPSAARGLNADGLRGHWQTGTG